MLRQGTPTNGEDVSGVEGAPVVEGTSPAVKHYKNLQASDLSHRGGTDQVGVFPVHSLQLHAGLEVVFIWAGRLLTQQNMKTWEQSK